MDYTLDYLKEALSNYEQSIVCQEINKKMESEHFKNEGEFVLALTDDEIQFLNNVLPDEIKYSFNAQDYTRGNQLNEVYELLIGYEHHESE
jgi:hypothetical protein